MVNSKCILLIIFVTILLTNCDSDNKINSPTGLTSGPILIETVEAQYPRQALLAGLEADVILEVDIDRFGSVLEIRIRKVIPYSKAGFAESAIKAVEQYKYQSALRNGRPVESRKLEIVEFKLPFKII